MKIAKIIVLLVILFITWPANSKDPDSYSAINCQELIKDYTQTSSWFTTNNSVVVNASLACASRLGRPYELIDVRLEVYVDGKLLTTIFSKNGYYSINRSRLLLPGISSVSHNLILKNGSSLVLDLSRGIIRAPYGFYLRLNNHKNI